MFNPRFQPFVDDHTNNYSRLRHEVYNSMAQGNYQYGAIASQFLKTNYDNFIVDY